MTSVTCGACGHHSSPSANFCSSCGTRIGAAGEPLTTASVALPAEVTGERGSIDIGSLDPGVGALVVTRGPNSGSYFVLDESLVTVGRHPDSLIFLDDITVSRRHAEIRRREDGYQVADAGSLNGTYLNRERIDDGMLEDGDELQVGLFKLLFIVGG